MQPAPLARVRNSASLWKSRHNSVLDRAVSFETDIYDALKLGLISMDSTMRSNLGVGLPIDLLVVRRDTCEAEVSYRIEPDEHYFQDLRERWSGHCVRRT
jgi:putative proteasome-type protease